jgi:hypothetical protein
MDEDVEVLKQYVESLGLHEKSELTHDDFIALICDLDAGSEKSLADYVKGLGGPDELADLITNTLYP